MANSSHRPRLSSSANVHHMLYGRGDDCEAPHARAHSRAGRSQYGAGPPRRGRRRQDRPRRLALARSVPDGDRAAVVRRCRVRVRPRLLGAAPAAPTCHLGDADAAAAPTGGIERRARPVGPARCRPVPRGGRCTIPPRRARRRERAGLHHRRRPVARPGLDGCAAVRRAPARRRGNRTDLRGTGSGPGDLPQPRHPVPPVGRSGPPSRRRPAPGPRCDDQPRGRASARRAPCRQPAGDHRARPVADRRPAVRT